MYICICNAIREKDLREAARYKSGSADEVYAVLGKKPNCGACLLEANHIVDEERQLICNSVAA
jgi:bacterioferritin-associated ferredoxin